MIRFRIRDEHGQYTGSNRYLVFPTDEEVQSIKSELWPYPEFTFPKVDLSKGGKSELEVKPEVKDKPLVKEEEGEPENIYQLYEKCFGPLTGQIGEELKELEKDYASYWIKDAFELSKKNKAQSLNYAKAILRGWTVRGGNGREPEEDALTKVAKEMGLK